MFTLYLKTKISISCDRLMNCLSHFDTIVDTEYIFLKFGWQKAVGRDKKRHIDINTDKAMNLRFFPPPFSSPLCSRFLALEDFSDKQQS